MKARGSLDLATNLFSLLNLGTGCPHLVSSSFDRESKILRCKGHCPGPGVGGLSSPPANCSFQACGQQRELENVNYCPGKD